MLPTKNYVDQPKTKSGHRVNEGNSQNMYFFYKKNHKKQQINMNFELALNNSVIMLLTKIYADRAKTKSAIVLTKVILKICTFSIKKIS